MGRYFRRRKSGGRIVSPSNHLFTESQWVVIYYWVTSEADSAIIRGNSLGFQMAAIVSRSGRSIRLTVAGFVLAALTAACVTTPPRPTGERPDKGLIIYSASRQGNAFAAAEEICRIVEETGRWCENRPGRGTNANLKALRRGRGDFAVVSSDLLHRALKGDAGETEGEGEGDATPAAEEEAKAGDETIRYVSALYPLAFTVLARREAGIAGPDGLAGKRIGLSGRLAGQLFRIIMGNAEWTEDSFAAFDTYPIAEVVPALCAGRIDAGLIVAAHPSHTTALAMEKGCARPVPMEGDMVDAVVAERPFLAPAAIPMGFYGQGGAVVETIGVPVVLVGSAKLPEDIVHQLAGRLVARYGGMPGDTAEEAEEPGEIPKKTTDNPFAKLVGALFPQTDGADGEAASEGTETAVVESASARTARRIVEHLFPDDGSENAVPACFSFLPNDFSREVIGALIPLSGVQRCGAAVMATGPGGRGMAHDGRTAPVHPGAARYYDENGLGE